MNKTLRTVIVSALVSATATTGALILVGPYDTGPWPICAYEDGNPGGDECAWINDGRVYYNDSAAYR